MAPKKRTPFEEIVELLNPAPERISDDEDVDDTRAKVVDNFDENLSEDDKPGLFVRREIALDDDPRYVGKKASRSKLGYDRTEDVGGDDSDDSNDEEADESGESWVDEEETSPGKYGNERDYESGEDYEGEEEEDDEDDKTEESGEGEDSDHEDRNGKVERKGGIKDSGDSFLHISSKSIASEVEKGKAVRHQLSLWENLLECRIHMQKCLVPANRLPKSDMMEHFRMKGGEEFNGALEENQTGVKHLLDKLLTLQEKLVASFPESKEVMQKAKTPSKRELDEEIPSDTEDEEAKPEEAELAEESKPKRKRRRLEDYENTIASHHKQYSEFRDSVIQKWNERTRIATGKLSSKNFSAFEQTTLQQIQQVLSNKSRLLQRTRLRRAFTNVLGEKATAEPTNGEQEDTMNEVKKVQLEHDSEIFDDSDFYQQLLRELIERRTGDTQDPTTLGRRWAALQKLRSKMKRKVDVRATKGRRLRYDPHPKLVSFMAPVEARSAWSDQAIKELHNSLFGNKRT